MLKENIPFKYLLLTISLILSLMICVYYWQNETLESIKYVSLHLMLYCLGYIVIQMVKRNFFSKRNWWDWLYYIGLLSVTLPTFIANNENESFYHSLTDYGVISFVIPLILDFYQLINIKKQ